MCHYGNPNCRDTSDDTHECRVAAVPQDWRTLPAGRALNVAVAERVLGAMIHEGQHDDYLTLPGERPVSDQRPVPDYSGDIAAAWQIVDAMRERGHLPHFMYSALADSWRANFRRDDAAGEWGCTAPFAICRAALAAVEGA